jgi:serine protease Do
MMKKLIHLSLLLFSLFTVILPAHAAFQGINFETVAEKAMPAIVSIHIMERENEKVTEDSLRFFNNDFFDRFFGSGSRNEGHNESENQAVLKQGSGFLVSEDGYILTNNHVIRGAKEIIIFLENGQDYTASVIGQDINTDLAVIKIEENNLPFIKLGDSDKIRVGQWVAAIGNPLGLQASLSAGIISAKGRSNLDIANIEDFIQTDAAINRGNSGGPLVNLEGEVIGINTAIASNTGGYMGIGFAIPSNIAKRVMTQLISSGSVSRGFLGVTLQAIDENLSSSFELKSTEGALVAHVIKNSPAAYAGLFQGDVLLKVNETPITSINTLRNTIALMLPGSSINLLVKRNGKIFTLTVELGLHPETRKNAKQGHEKQLGLEVLPWSIEQAH